MADERYLVKSETIGKLMRMDITLDEFYSRYPSISKLTFEDWHPEWSDMEAILDKLEKDDPLLGDVFRSWGIMFRKVMMLRDAGGDGGEDTEEDELPGDNYLDFMSHIVWAEEGDDEKYPGYTDRLDITSPGSAKKLICSAIACISFKKAYENVHAVSSGAIDIRRMRADIEAFKAERWEDEITGWKWTDLTKFDALEHPEGYGFTGPAIRPEELPEAREILNELCDRDNVRALHMRTYSAYGGSYLWECDWNVSRDSLLRLMELDTVTDKQKCVYANTLGYIYYYGRCSDNVPDYDKALKYFSVGAAGGVYESVYKIADMLKGGKGLPKNLYGARSMLLWAYDKTRKVFLNGAKDSDFADAALRVGSLLHEMGENEEALTVLLQADYAVHERMKETDCYGDDHVAIAIRKEISEIRREVPKTDIPKKASFPLFEIINSFVYDPGPARGWAERDGSFVDMAVISHYGNQQAFITLPEAGYCTVSNVVHYRFEDVEDFHVRENKKEFIFDRYVIDDEDDRVKVRFLRDGKEMCRIDASTFSVMLPEDEDMIVPGGEEHLIASCSFTEDGRTYDYLADGMSVEEGNLAIVDTWNGETTVFVRKVYMMSEAELPLPLEKYKKLIKVL